MGSRAYNTGSTRMCVRKYLLPWEEMWQSQTVGWYKEFYPTGYFLACLQALHLTRERTHERVAVASFFACYSPINSRDSFKCRARNFLYYWYFIVILLIYFSWGILSMSIANPCPIEISFIQFGIKRRVFRVANYGFFNLSIKNCPFEGDFSGAKLTRSRNRRYFFVKH